MNDPKVKFLESAALDLAEAISAAKHGRWKMFKEKLTATRARLAKTETGPAQATTTLTLSRSEHEALMYALDIALDDQENYIEGPYPRADYGSEWSSVAKEKAGHFNALARSGIHYANRWRALAKAVRSR